MASSIRQDMPPQGGFKEIVYKRNVPTRSPSGFVIYAAGAGIMAFGFYRIIQGNQRRRRLQAETVSARAALVPFLQAEDDRRQVRQQYQQLRAEELLMKDNKDWKVGEKVYNAEHYVRPAQPVQLGTNV